MQSCIILILTVLAGIRPLTDEQRAALETAFDGRDHREAAFFALIENAESWTISIQDLEGIPNAIHVQWQADPDASRGELYRTFGRLEQVFPLEEPYDHAIECFVRLQTGEPILVYVPVRFMGSDTRAGESIDVIARFYKRIDDTARDGISRSYAAFIGIPISRPASGGGPRFSSGLWIAIITFGLLLIAVPLWRVVQRQRKTRKQRSDRGRIVAEVDAEDSLPDDPAAALAELHRRADR